MYLIKPSQVGNDKIEEKRRNMKKDKECPLKYVKLVSSNEGNGKKESGGKGKFLVKRERKRSDSSKDSH